MLNRYRKGALRDQGRLGDKLDSQQQKREYGDAQNTRTKIGNRQRGLRQARNRVPADMDDK